MNDKLSFGIALIPIVWKLVIVTLSVGILEDPASKTAIDHVHGEETLTRDLRSSLQVHLLSRLP